MTPGARVQAAIELLDAMADSGGPADQLLSHYFRRRRYVGAKDRNAIRGTVYGVLRNRAGLDWWIERATPAKAATAPGRLRAIAGLALLENWPADEVTAAFDGGTYRPSPLSGDESAVLGALVGAPLAHAEQPAWVRGNYPEWLTPELEASFGGRLAEEMAAMNLPATVDLRVNTLKATREEVVAALAAEGVEAAPTPLSPIGLRLAGRRTLPALDAFRRGLVEVQDEGSQIVALLTDARPGQSVADYCAGGGGKSLALAAAMENRGRLVACDIAERRFGDIAKRCKRAGAAIVETHVMAEEGDDGLDAGSFDRVLVDVPCSGAGAWRRNPDAKWRLGPDELAEHTARQARILDRAARLVAPGGRLVYATCSILASENAPRIDRFLSANPDFTLLPAADIWSDIVDRPMPSDGACLTLTPARDGTDGFFAAIMERRAHDRE
jgi:16S rRNA (cytosine967-C5)-methyltransferase